jgi:hypothetical protein
VNKDINAPHLGDGFMDRPRGFLGNAHIGRQQKATPPQGAYFVPDRLGSTIDLPGADCDVRTQPSQMQGGRRSDSPGAARDQTHFSV